MAQMADTESPAATGNASIAFQVNNDDARQTPHPQLLFMVYQRTNAATYLAVVLEGVFQPSCLQIV